MQIVIGNVGAPFKDGKFFKFDLHYSRDGKPTTRKIVGVGKSQKVFDVLKEASIGSTYEIELEQDGDYWNWVGAKKVLSDYVADVTTTDRPVQNSSQGKYVARSANTYETPEERTAKQAFIIRQSSLDRAVTVLGNKAAIDEYFNLAEKFVDFVYDNYKEIKDDIPFDK